MRATGLLAVTAVLTLGAAGSGLRSHAPVRPAAADPRLSAVKVVLRDLVVTQEKYYSAHGTYTTDAAALGLIGPSKPDSIKPSSSTPAVGRGRVPRSTAGRAGRPASSTLAS